MSSADPRNQNQQQGFKSIALSCTFIKRKVFPKEEEGEGGEFEQRGKNC